MNENQINELIKKIVNEIIARTSEVNDSKTLVLVAELSAYSREAAEYLSDKQVVAALFGEGEISGIESKRIDTSEDKKNIIMAMRNTEEVVLAACIQIERIIFYILFQHHADIAVVQQIVRINEL